MDCFELINKTDGNPPTFEMKQLFWDLLDRFNFSPFTKICIYFAVGILVVLAFCWLKTYLGAFIARKGELTAEKRELKWKNRHSHSEFEDRLLHYSHAERNHPNDYHYCSGSVDFIGRTPEMKILQDFCQATQHILWTAILADGGSGKSRLAYEFYKKQKGETDWYSIFITGAEAAELASFSDIQCQKNVLIIIDYFGCKAEPVSKLLAKWPKGNGRLRLLLLEREVPKEDHFRAQWYTAFSEYRGMIYSGNFIYLSSMPDQIEEIAKSYAKHKNYSLSSTELQSIHTVINQIDPEKHRPLFVICIVDAICRGDLATTWRQSDLLEDICRHEEARILSAVEIEKKSMESLLCFASMCGGISESMSHSFPLEVQNAWNSLGENHLSIFHSINGTSNDAGILAPLEPDIIREKYVLSALAKMTISSRNRWIHAAWETQPERFAEFLIRIIEDFGCEVECTSDLVYQIFDEVPENPYAQEFYAIAVSSITQWEWMEKSRQSKAVEKLRELFELTTCEKIGELYAIALYNILTISDDIHEKTSAFRSLNDLFSTTHSARISKIYAVGILFLFTTGSNIFTNIEYISQLEQLYRRFPSPVTEFTYASALFKYSTYEECIEKGWVIAKLEEIFNSVSSGIVDESYANALINIISAEKNVVKKREFFCKLKAIYQKRKSIQNEQLYAKGLFNLFNGETDICTKKQIACELHDLYASNRNPELATPYAMALVNLTLEDIPLTEKRGYLAQLDQIYNSDRVHAIAEWYARGLVNVAIDETAIAVKEKNLALLYQLYLNEKSNDVAEWYANGLYNLSLDDPCIKHKIRYINKLGHYYNKTRMLSIKKSYVNGLSNLMMEGINLNYKRTLLIRLLLHFNPEEDLSIAGIASQCLFNLSTVDNCLCFKRKYVNFIEKIYIGNKNDAILEWYVKGLHNQVNAEKNIYQKRRYLDKLDCLYSETKNTDVAILFAEGLFNLSIDSKKYSVRKQCVSKLAFLYDNTHILSVARQYAMSLVNFTDDCDVSIAEKQDCLNNLKTIALSFSCPELLDHYIGGLYNLCLYDPDEKRKMEYAEEAQRIIKSQKE